jgi:hypothetical protein
MKAYAVRTDYSEGSGIVFAESHNKAKMLALYTDACEDAPYIDIRAKRIPELDGMENCEPKDNPWLNEDIRMILVKEYGWGCVEPGVYEDCDKCCAKQYCHWCEE